MAKDMIPLKASKAALRKAVQASLKRLSDADIAEQSSQVYQRLLSTPEYQNARSIGVYLSMPTGEVLTKPIVQDALRRGKTVLVPYIYKNSTTGPRSLMDMVALTSEDDLALLKPDRWGIPSLDPSSVTRRVRCLCKSFEDESEREGSPERVESLDLIVLPGVAFDTTRHRLGHGKGFYDIFLSQYREHKGSDSEVNMPYLVGLALDPQILPDGQAVPVDASDWTLDAIIGTSRIVT